MDNIITVQEARTLSREISAQLRDERIIPFIKEAEDLYVRPAVSDDIYLDILHELNAEKYAVLLNGGVYRGGTKYCSGLKKTTAYYTYAKILLNNQIAVTSYGVVQKSINESQQIERGNLMKAYNDAMITADKYMAECVVYIKEELKKETKGITSSRVKIKSIG